MQFFILVIIICLLVFLYCVYLLAKDDFIFLRRDVTMERLFNLIFLGGLVSLFTARFFYGILYAKNILLNPFIFLLFPYFPGMSLLGGVLGAGLTFLFLARNKKNPLPLRRMSDFFSIAFLITLPVGILGYFMFSENGISFVKASSLIAIYFVLFIVFLKFLLPLLLTNKLKEGTITLIFLICFSLINLVSSIFSAKSLLDFFKNPENLIFIAIFIFSAGLFLRYESLLIKINLPAILRKALQAGELKKGK